MGRLRVLSRDHLLFADRTQAGDWLAELLAGYRGGDTIILGIPRGEPSRAWKSVYGRQVRPMPSV